MPNRLLLFWAVWPLGHNHLGALRYTISAANQESVKNAKKTVVGFGLVQLSALAQRYRLPLY